MTPITDILLAAGPWLYPLVAVAVCLAASAIAAGLAIARSEGSMPASGPPHHPVLAWGVLGVVLGLLGTAIGFAQVAGGARAAAGGDFSELEAMLAVLWDGVLVIMTPLMLGLGLFTLALTAWLVLDLVLKRTIR